MRSGAIGRAVLRTLWFIVLLSALVFPVTLGVVGAYIGMIACLLLVPLLVVDKAARDAAFAEPAARLLALAFVLLLIAFSLSARAPNDVLLIANFLPLLLFLPAYAASRRVAGPMGVRVVALVTTAALGLAVLVARHSLTLDTVDRAQLPNDNSLHFAAMLTVLSGIALIGLFSRKAVVRLAGIVGMVLGLIAVIATQSRGAVLAYPVFGLFALLVALRHYGVSRRLSVATVVGLALTGTLAVLVLDDQRRALTGFAMVLEFARTGEVSEVSAAVRLDLYTAAIEAFWQKPWFGHGWANFYAATDAIVRERMGPASQFAAFGHLHSDLADLAVAAGVLGIAALALILLAPIAGALASPSDGWRSARLYGALALSSSYAVLGATNLMFGWELQTASYVFIAAIVLGFCRAEKPAPRV
ncbi:MAG: O-antigen ligase family protein [Devosia sp.]